MTIDLPWYAQWLEHHQRIGFTHFHLHYCDDLQIPLEQAISYNSMIELQGVLPSTDPAFS
jgi:hypothetical protein